MWSVGRTIYLVSEGSYVRCNDVTITVDMKDGSSHSVGYDAISQIVIFYDATTLSAYVMRCCAEHLITIHYISCYGKYIGSFMGDKTGNVLLRRLQFQMIGSSKSLELVRNLLCAKFRNAAWLLKYFGYHNTQKNKIDNVVDSIRVCTKSLKLLQSIDDMRVLEAQVAKLYYSCFDDLLKVEDFCFEKRSQRPPLNEMNALLSFFYTMCTTICDSALLVKGLDAECGYLHTLRSGRKSLACDLVEEFRACIVDRFVISIINRKEVVLSDFLNENGKIRLNDDKRKILLQKWTEYLNHTMVKHRLYDKEISLKILMYEQAQLLAQYVRGDIDAYPAFFMK